jgi:hypothetical protein
MKRAGNPRAECQKDCGEAAPLHGSGTLLNRSVIM